MNNFIYRVGHHSTSDDSTAYRPIEEVKEWGSTHSPIFRLRQYLHNKGWWDDDKEYNWKEETKKMVTNMLSRDHVERKVQKYG